MIIKINYYFQKKEKSLKIFTNKRLDKIEELNKKNWLKRSKIYYHKQWWRI